MRGARATLPPRRSKVDLLITAARYDRESGELVLAKGYEPTGDVWSDVKLFEREELVERLRSGERVAFGRNVDLATDFELGGFLWLESEEAVIVAEGESASQDQLGVPRF